VVSFVQHESDDFVAGSATRFVHQTPDFESDLDSGFDLDLEDLTIGALTIALWSA
jgi:hypothetical protein